ncbi:MAG: phospholipase D family protein [Chloroflexota bacterium]
MADTESAVFVNQDVASRILRILSEAQKYVIMVTPYLKLWNHDQLEIEKAIKRGVQVRFIVRSDSNVTGSEDVGWLRSHGVKVSAVDGLHAKVYLNESMVVISSMNITAPSATNSFEIGCLVKDKGDAKTLRDYVFQSLAMVAKPLDGNGHKSSERASPARERHDQGVCIRCEQRIPLDTARPLCGSCFGIWSRWADPEYPENHCHNCGRQAIVSYARPLCRTCYHRQA